MKNLSEPSAPLRPREKLKTSGTQGLSDRELMALILSSGCRDTPLETLVDPCLSVLDKHRGQDAYRKLLALRGIGPTKAAQVVGAMELSRRINLPGHHRVRTPSDAWDLIRRFAQRPQEHFLCISLNGAHEVIRCRLLTVGLLNRTLIHPREVFCGPLKDRAAGILVGHNHPSGVLEPSVEDRDITRRLTEAGQILGIPLLDHLIFSPSGFFSFQESGLL